jgi:ketosteroid isomerase-like protein
MIPDWVAAYYAAVDANDFASCFEQWHDDIELQFGSRPPAKGREDTRTTLAAAHAPWVSVSHEIRNLWETPDEMTLIEFLATYDLKAGGTKTIPTFTVLHRTDRKIDVLRVYIDEASLAG